MELPGSRAPQELIDKLKPFMQSPQAVPLPVYDATPGPSLASLKEIDLRQHLARFEGLPFNGKGTCLCPVHAETGPSFEVKRDADGHWYWFDWHNQGRDGFSGTIIDYYVTIKGLSVGEAIRTIREREYIQEPAAKPLLKPSQKGNGKDPQVASLVRPAFTGTLADFFKADLPEAEVLVEGLLAREEFMLLGGVKHAHKTTAMMDLGLHYAAGWESWLNFPIPRPGRFLMVQQELGESEFRKRLRKAVDGGRFNPDNFFPYTGTSEPIKLMEDEGFNRLRGLCDKFKPDILGLDPLHTFMVGGENKDEAFAAIRDRINYLKTTYGCGVITSHHFSSKRPNNDPDAPAEAAGWFRGHSVLADAADVLFLLHRLPGQKDNPNLRLSYEAYNQVEITLRNGKWPPRFAVEFDGKTFLMSVSDIWHEVGAKIGFGEIRELCKAHGDSITLANAILYFKTRDQTLSPMTVRKAVEKEFQAGYVITEKLPGRGNPLLIKSK